MINIYKRSIEIGGVKLSINGTYSQDSDCIEADSTFNAIKDLIQELDKAFELKTLQKSGRKNIVIKKIESAIGKIKSDNLTANRELAALGMLAKTMNQLKTQNYKCYRRLLTDTRKQGNSSSWPGVRAEIAIAGLLSHNLSGEFIKGESPDFYFKLQNTDYYAEVTSTTKTDESSYSEVNKIVDAIRKKSKKKYANHNTILFIDITNIMNRRFSDKETDDQKFFNNVKNHADLTTYGAIILFGFLFLPTERRYQLFCTLLNGESQQLVDFYKSTLEVGPSGFSEMPIFPSHS